MKDFLNRFGALVVKLHTKDEAVMVHAFKRGSLSGPFNNSVIRCRQKRLARSAAELLPTSVQRKR